MGIKLKDIVEPEKINFRDLEGKVIAIDAFNTIYQFLSGIRQRDGRPLVDNDGNITSHLSGILYRNSSIIEKGIKPIYVFDGTSSSYKANTVVQRQEIRKESEEKYKEALEKGDSETARKYAIRSSKMTPYILESSKRLLALMGIPCIDAASEGEAQAAYMVKKGDAWAVASQDYDCLALGAQRTIRNLTISSNTLNLEYYELAKVLKRLNITREELVDISLLVGTDFNDGTKGIGAKTALKLAKKNKLKEAIDNLKKESVEDIDEIRNIFLKPKVNTNYKIKWKKPNKEGAVEFLCGEHGFSQQRVISATSKLKKLNNGQKSLEDWF